MVTLAHEWPGYEPHHVIAVLKTGETLDWSEFWAVDRLQILETLKDCGLDLIWLQVVQIPEPTPRSRYCPACYAEPGEPCRAGCLGLGS